MFPRNKNILGAVRTLTNILPDRIYTVSETYINNIYPFKINQGKGA